MLQSQGSFETGIDDSCLLPVVERFVSVNGEGPRAGRLAAFIRFAAAILRAPGATLHGPMSKTAITKIWSLGILLNGFPILALHA